MPVMLSKVPGDWRARNHANQGIAYRLVGHQNCYVIEMRSRRRNDLNASKKFTEMFLWFTRFVMTLHLVIGYTVTKLKEGGGYFFHINFPAKSHL